MKQFYLIILFIIAELVAMNLNAQKWLIVGRNKDSPDGVSIVCTEDVTSSDVVYVTEDEYNNLTNVFVTGESIAKYTPPAGGHVAGEVISFEEGGTGTGNNVYQNVQCSSGNCGTVSNVGGSIAIGTTDELYAYSDSDDNPGNGVTEIYCAWFWNGSEGAGEDPTGDYPDAQKLSFPDVSKLEYTVADRNMNVTAIIYEDLNSYTASGSNSALSVTPFTGGFAVPVDFAYFTGERIQSEIELTWGTANELDNERFEVERSIDGKAFQKIGTIMGSGTTAEEQHYKYMDTRPAPGINFYRLRQIDYDGTFDYSSIVSVLYDSKTKPVGEFYPSPSLAGPVNISYTASQDEELHVSVFDASGKVVLELEQQLVEGSNILSFNFSQLQAGMYFVQMSNGGENPIHRRLVIK